MNVERMEVWIEVPGSNGAYEVSSHGTVRSWHNRTDKPHILKPYAPNNGYETVRLALVSGLASVRVHRLVAELHIPNPNGYRTVNHIDGNKRNNRIDNLEWSSYAENIQHSYDVGLRSNRARGARMNTAVLDDSCVLRIRTEYSAGGISQRALADKYGVSQNCIHRIVTNQTWTHLGADYAG